MLNGLDQVGWDRLTHAYGPADDVPDQIRDLVSPDEDRRQKALWELSGNIYHQGTIYEATAYAVPFLLEVLTAPECDEQPQLLSLLCSIVTGFDEMWLPGGLPVADHRARAAGGEAVLAAAPRPGDDGFDEDEADYEYVEGLSDEDRGRMFAHIWVRAYDAVRAGVPVFRALLTWEPPVACMAAYTLAWFPEDAPESLRALANLTEGDDEGVVAATAAVATGLLGGRPAITLDDPRPIARWGAAIALATVDGPDATDDVVDELISAAAGALPDSDRVPFLDGNLAAYAGGALRLTGDRHAARTFDALLERVPSVSGTSAFHVVKEALHLAFPAGALPAGTGYPSLDDRQRRLVDALAGSPGTWLIDGRNFGNFGMLVREYGLPASSDALRDYATTR
ncbi:hypothetical protein SAMN04488564_108193 [Lentzea waywayandensis]|uniref:HEAT repeat-containing protein n=1 Tax=Lentzea waywayandensis TaxID=84724 RepID=A0A1I6F515_9PSEU|nr:hypothetical protein [Lentzea waywayandensis]SFR25028.1 hypothetical protein SAMN04488564_108193 [Lentzea waywayandensis]